MARDGWLFRFRRSFRVRFRIHDRARIRRRVCRRRRRVASWRGGVFFLQALDVPCRKDLRTYAVGQQSAMESHSGGRRWRWSVRAHTRTHTCFEVIRSSVEDGQREHGEDDRNVGLAAEVPVLKNGCASFGTTFVYHLKHMMTFCVG